MTVQFFGYFLKFLSCYEFWHLVLGYFWACWLRSLFAGLSLLFQRSWVTWPCKEWYFFFPKVKWYANLAFETVNAMKLWREADDASTPVPEVEGDMNLKIVISSDAPELSSARIQLEPEAFQLCSARLVGFLAHLLKIPSLPQPYVTILPIFLEVLWYL